MSTSQLIRPGEVSVELPPQTDAGVYYIGRIRTPWPNRSVCPRRGDLAGPECRIELYPRWQRALEGVASHSYLQVLYWMHEAPRNLVVQVPRRSGQPVGTFALRSPARANPIASSVVALVRQEGLTIVVSGLDCMDGTALIDLKPAREVNRSVTHQAPA